MFRSSNRSLPLGFLTKILNGFLISVMCTTCPARLILSLIGYCDAPCFTVASSQVPANA
jgi:hypothetical protein